MYKNDLSLLPESAAPYKRTPLFSANTVPKGLTNDHSTKEGVYGLLHVKAGDVMYHVPSENSSELLKRGDKMLIKPTLVHRVALSPEAEFFVEFWR